jgi:hypothetical protein
VWSGLYVFHLYVCNLRALSLYQDDPSRRSGEATVYKLGVEQPGNSHNFPLDSDVSHTSAEQPSFSVNSLSVLSVQVYSFYGPVRQQHNGHYGTTRE